MIRESFRERGPMDRPMGTPIGSVFPMPFTRTPEEQAIENYERKKKDSEYKPWFKPGLFKPLFDANSIKNDLKKGLPFRGGNHQKPLELWPRPVELWPGLPEASKWAPRPQK